MKREAIGEGESSLNEDSLLPLCEQMLQCRQEDIDKLNKMFDTNISVDFDSAWKNNQKSIKIELEKTENEASQLAVGCDENEASQLAGGGDENEGTQLTEDLNEVDENEDSQLAEDLDEGGDEECSNEGGDEECSNEDEDENKDEKEDN